MKLNTKKEKNSLSSNLHTMSQVITLALENQAKGESMWDGQKPEDVLKNIAHGLWVLSEELKSA